jgi:hypothetical protein
MSMTRDTYAKEVIKAAESAFRRNEKTVCPHEDCDEVLGIMRQNVFSTRSLFCPVHGHIFQEQEAERYNKLDWDGAKQRFDEQYSDIDLDDEEESEESEGCEE